MSKTDNKQAQQNYGRFHSLATHIQHHPYISLTIPSLIFIAISVTHFLISDKTLQTIIQVIAYILGLIIVIILFSIVDNQRKADSSKINLIFLSGIFPAILFGFAYFSKIIGDITAIIIGIAGIATQILIALHTKTGKSEESDIQENLSDPSPEFIQENSSTSIQNNSPTTIQENNNSPISIQHNSNSSISVQHNFTTNQNITNIIDKQSEREIITDNACEMLNSKNLVSRISAVKTLANMADFWLEDAPNYKKDEKKCQDIIDILCAYIRGSFLLAENRRDIESSTSNMYTSADRQALRDEQEVRRLIFEEISLRLSTLDENLNIHQGRWSKFKFNFSESPIFYNLNNLTLEQIDIWQLKFFGDINFENSIFIHKFVFPSGLETNISLKGATFCSDAAFEHAGFFGEVNFSDATFLKEADFQHARFGSGLSDLRNNELDRSLPLYVNQLSPANFKNVEFYGEAIFYGARFRKDAYFDNAKFMDEVDFRSSNSREELSFKEAVFKKNVYFSDMQWRVNINFTEAVFSESITRAKFSSMHITHKNIRTSTVPAGLLDFSNGKYIDPQYSWSCLPIPSGARMALSDSWDEKKKNYVKGSSPAR